LIEAIQILKNVEEIVVSILKEHDVVRHSLMQKIVKAYGEAESR